MSMYSRLAALGVAVLLWLPVPGHADSKEGMSKGLHSQQEGGLHQYVSHSFQSLIHHAKDLGLSDEQVTKLKTLMGDYEKAKIRGEADIKLAEVDVQTLAHDDKADMAAIENAIRKSEAVHANLRIEGIKALRAAKAALTPEQQQKWRASRGSMHGEGKGKGDYKEPGQQPPKK